MVDPLLAAMRERPMSGGQVLVVALCVLINAIDGFDILALSFAAPIVSREWALTPEQTGLVFSANLAGIGIGALLFAMIADVVGRRPVILLGTLLMSLGMISTAFTDGAAGLAGCRLVTGLGIGAMVATAGTLAIEYSSQRWRTLSVALVVIGYPVGGMLGGFAASALLELHGWRSIFLFGGALTVVLFPLLLWRLPESIEFLLERQPAGALARIGRLAARFGLPAVAALPARAARGGVGAQFLDLWRPPSRASSLRIAVMYPLFMFTFYFFINWSTKLATERGLEDSAAIAMSSLVNLGGIPGGFLFGLLATRLALPRVVASLAALMALGVALFGLLLATPLVLNAAAVGLGFVMWGASATIYSIIALSYPARSRATAVGTIVTIGRVGSALGPAVAGFLRGAGYEWAAVCLLLALPGLLAAALLLGTRPDHVPVPAAGVARA